MIRCGMVRHSIQLHHFDRQQLDPNRVCLKRPGPMTACGCWSVLNDSPSITVLCGQLHGRAVLKAGIRMNGQFRRAGSDLIPSGRVQIFSRQNSPPHFLLGAFENSTKTEMGSGRNDKRLSTGRHAERSILQNIDSFLGDRLNELTELL